MANEFEKELKFDYDNILPSHSFYKKSVISKKVKKIPFLTS